MKSPTRRLYDSIRKNINKARALDESLAVAHLKAAAWYIDNDTKKISERIERMTAQELEIACRTDEWEPR